MLLPNKSFGSTALPSYPRGRRHTGNLADNTVLPYLLLNRFDMHKQTYRDQLMVIREHAHGPEFHLRRDIVDKRALI